MSLQEKLKEVREYIKTMELLEQATGIVYWDMRVGMPKKAVEQRAEVVGYLSGEGYKFTTSEKVKEFIEFFKPHLEELSVIDKAMIEELKRGYEEIKKIPEDRYKEYVILSSKSEAAWEEAKEKNDFSIFKPYLEKVIDFQKEFLEYTGYTGTKYDSLLDKYERGITVAKLDEVFGELRDAIVELLNKIKNSKIKIDDSFFKKSFTREEQEEFSIFVLKKMGYDFEAGKVDESVHPFTINFGNKDVRITTHYYENEFRSALFSCIHEGGHAIYEQDIPDELIGTGLGAGVSMGIHESQSRFYENILGRSKAFWKYFFPEAKSRFPQLEDVTFEEFYKAINIVEPSLIRTEADELTYSLHVIIRYEIEKLIFNGEVEVADLPRIWNEKYKEYLGVEPSNDSEGILQDMHWSDGSFGYFPSYALGNLYGAQMLQKMLKDNPKVFDEVENGDLDTVHQWLKENVHKHGAVYKPADLIKLITGEELNAKYFIKYLNDKYQEIYDLK
ncbi:carboxypeptidase M32 [Clostridium sp. C8-1-8]|uniref:carboxypeptidase M32 n=1 Tax=Clostridium sp. C8-1-8 TaxID=2698831 RepID=UPI001371F403|nr:carboxypeptidase M32 [Clostridium sp. C8-1-8]